MSQASLFSADFSARVIRTTLVVRVTNDCTDYWLNVEEHNYFTEHDLFDISGWKPLQICRGIKKDIFNIHGMWFLGQLTLSVFVGRKLYTHTIVNKVICFHSIVHIYNEDVKNMKEIKRCRSRGRRSGRMEALSKYS